MAAGLTLAIGLSTPAFADPGGTGAGHGPDSDGSPTSRIAPSDFLGAPGTDVPYTPLDPSYSLLAPGDVDQKGLELLTSAPKPAALDLAGTNGWVSNLAFKDDYVFQGGYAGLAVRDISDPANPVEVASVLCPGGQGDLAIAGDLIFFSVDAPRAGSECGAPAVAASSTQAWEGIRIFDISDPTSPQYVKAVGTRCGSHTNTLVPKPGDDGSVYLYTSAYDVSTTAAYCKTPHQQVEVIDVDLENPEAAEVVKELKFWDEDNPGFALTDRKDGGASTSVTNGCHDLTAYPEKNLLAAACMGDGLMVDITDPLNPSVIDRVRDENFAFWHTAQFSNDASKVVFQDELGGGTGATCVPGVPQYRGANGIYTFEDDNLELASYFKIPRRQSTTENCVNHEGNILPHPTKDLLIQAWYRGGVSIIDFTDEKAPTEVGYFDRGPITGTGGSWAAYVHNGYVYSSEIAAGLDVFELAGDDYADARRHRREGAINNPATQESFSLPWLDAPVYDDAAALPSLSIAPSTVLAGSAPVMTVTAPAGTYAAGEYVDVWSAGEDAAVLATGQAAADGSASLEFTLPAGLPAGTFTAVVRGDRQLDSALRKVTVELSALETSTTLTSTAAAQRYGSTPVTMTATVTASDLEAVGSVEFVRGETVVATVPVVEGKATYRPASLLGVNTYSFTARFVPGDGTQEGSVSAPVALRVAQGTSSTRIGIGAGRVSTNANAVVKVRVTAAVPQNGRVTVRYGNREVRATVRNGAVDVRLPKLTAGTYRVQVTYDGNRNIAASRSAAATLTVVQR